MARKTRQTSSATSASTETYTLRITPLRAPQVHRTVEVPGAVTLAGLHVLIQHVFELDDDHLYAFFLTNKPWDRKDVYSRMPSKPWERDAAKAKLSSFGLSVGRTFLYIFDFGDELQHSIEVVAKGAFDPELAYPRMVDLAGDVPPQYPDDEDVDDEEDDEEFEPLAPEHRALADDVAECVDAYDEYLQQFGDVDEDEPAPIERVRRDLEVARRLLKVLRASPDQWGALDHNELVEEWLTTVPHDLADHERMDDAVSLAFEIDEVCGARFVGTPMLKASILIRADRKDEARALIESWLAESPDDPAVLEDAAELFEDLDEPARAEALWQKLAPLGVHRFEVDAPARLGLGPELAPVPFVNAAPKVGRNEPCPCGSGKKFKKCCG